MIAADPRTSSTGTWFQHLRKFCAGGQPKARGVIMATDQRVTHGASLMNSIIYLVGLVVVILAILSFFGLR